MENVVVIVGEHSDVQELDEMIKKKKLDISISYYKIQNWNEQLSPWKFEEFGNGAEQTLQDLKQLYDLENTYLVGYSLAGLFCLWASFQCEIKGIGCCSGSLWFDHFIEYMEHDCFAKKIYFSLGKKEKKTRHPIRRTIQDKTEEAYHCIQSKNIETILELKNGNHFFAISERTINAMEWLIKGE